MRLCVCFSLSNLFGCMDSYHKLAKKFSKAKNMVFIAHFYADSFA